MTPYKIEAGTGQHIGDRKEQQDRIGLFSSPRAPGYMMAVLADGMGGAGGGGIAAEQAIATAQQIFQDFSPRIEDVDTMLREVVGEIHTVIQLLTLASDLRPQSTLAILVLTPQREAVWAHVGDSRVYRFAGAVLAERTLDQTGLVPSLTGTGKPGGTLLNVIGNPRITPKIEIRRHPGLKAGDAFLLCSDGFWRHVSDNELGAVIAGHSTRDAAQRLIHMARERATDGNADNCTLGIVRLVNLPT